MKIDLADIARGRRIVALAALELARLPRTSRPRISLIRRLVRSLAGFGGKAVF